MGLVAATAFALASSSGLAVAAQSVPVPAHATTIVAGEGFVKTWAAADGTPMVAISLDGRTIGRVVEQRPTIRLRYAEFDPAAGVPAVPASLRATPDNRAFIVQYVSQPLEAYARAIEDLGGRVERFMPDQAQIVTIDPARVDELADLPFVRWVGAYHPAYKLNEPDLQRLLLGEPAAGDAPVRRRYSIQTLRRGDGSLDALAADLAQQGTPPTLQSEPVGRLEAWLTDAELARLATRSDVLFMDERGEPETDVNIARLYGGADFIEDTLGFTGQGVRAEVMDIGFFLSHQEFDGVSVEPHGTIGGGSHGTSVYSIMFAQGVNPEARGFLPDAEATFVADNGSLTDRFRHTAELVDPTGPFRAVLQTNSWGNPRTTQYDTISSEMDDILFQNNIIITQSQSNSGGTPSRPQAWAKNIVSVGGFLHRGTLDRGDDCWCSTGSTGPAADGRIKPDLAHFYDETLAASDGGSGYTQFGGTSGATPITAGHFGLFFQMWSEGVFGPVPVPGGTVFENRPQATTAKAMMINTAQPYDFSGPSADMSRFRQGWGPADLQRLYELREKFLIVDHADVLEPLESISYPVTVSDGEPELRVTLVYPDVGGTTSATKHRVNDLSLRVTSPTGEVFWGNVGLTEGNQSQPGGSENDLDTVENVWITDPAAGSWTIEVIASEINEDGHVETATLDADYSLVASGVTPSIGLALQSDVPDILLPGESLPVEVEVVEGDESLVGTPTIHFDVDGSGFTSAPMADAGGGIWTFSLPAAVCDQSPAFYMEATGDGGTTVTLPPAGADAPLVVDRVGEVIVDADFDFEDATGWTVEDTLVADGGWEAGVIVDHGRGAPEADADGSGSAFTTGLGDRQDLDGGPTVLTSPVFDLSASSQDVVMTYNRWFTNDDSDEDRLTIEISDDGGSSWTVLESVADDGVSDQEWVAAEWRLADVVSLTSQVRVRFTVTDNPNDSITEAAIDGFNISAFVCDGACPADFDGDGELTVFDFLDFQSAFDAGEAAADFDGDGELTLFDFLAFSTAFDAGCP